METLVQGQNTKLSSQILTAQFASGLPLEVSRKALDINAFMVGANNKVSADEDFVFFNQPNHPSGCLRVIPGALQYELNIAKIPAHIEKIILAVTIDSSDGAKTSFAAASYISLAVRGNQTDILFRMESAAMTETSLILAEFYRRNAEWKFKAVGQGFVGGLDPLARHFGVDVDQGSAPEASPAPPAPPPPPPAADSGSRVNLSKVTLAKRKPLSLEKQSDGFGEMILNLNWTQKPRGGGLLGGLMGGGQSIDLDLGAMVEYRTSEKIVVQALGNSFGNFQDPPWIQLMGDDRTGAQSQGEIIRINGQYWQYFKRVLVFAFIYEGVPNWARADGSVTIKIPKQPVLEVLLDNHDDKKTMCAIAMLDNIDESIRITKLVDYFEGHPEMDQAFGFGFRWKTGSK